MAKLVPPISTAIDDLIEQEQAQTAPTGALERITDAYTQLEQVRERLDALQKELKELERVERSLLHSVLPSLLDEAQTRALTLSNGYELKRTETVYASISKANAQAATRWLVANGYGALVKAAIHVRFAKGDAALAKLVREALTAQHIAFEETAEVHPQTLKAFVRESLELGRVLPDSITYHTEPTVEVKQSKE